MPQSRPPRFGLYLPSFGPFGDPAVLLDLARRAEAAGWDGLFLWDHLLGPDGVAVLDPWVMLAALAGVTARLRLGTMVTPLPRRRPWVLARQAATLSRISMGRCVLGVGLGSDEYGDFSRFGERAGLAERAEMADEGLAIVTALWAGRGYQQPGAYYQVEFGAAEPEPYPIPVWVASTLPALRSLRRAARYDGVVLLDPSWRVTAADVALAVDLLGPIGRRQDPSYEVVVTGNASPAWPDAPAVDLPALAAAGMTWWLESLVHVDPLELSLQVVDAGPPRSEPAPQPSA